jgi:hypothetical protein
MIRIARIFGSAFALLIALSTVASAAVWPPASGNWPVYVDHAAPMAFHAVVRELVEIDAKMPVARAVFDEIAVRAALDNTERLRYRRE